MKNASGERVAVFPGSFDPFTNGHLDIVERSLEIFDRVIVAVSYNATKDSALFTPQERVEMIRESTRSPRVVGDSFSGLLVDFVERSGAQAIVRGLRAVADFEYEFQMAMMNRHLRPRIETIFIMASEAHFYTSSRLVKEVASLGGDVTGLIPSSVRRRLARKLSMQSPGRNRAAEKRSR